MSAAEMALAFALLGAALATAGLIVVQRYLGQRFARFEALSEHAATERRYATHLLERIVEEHHDATDRARRDLAEQRSLEWASQDQAEIRAEASQHARMRRMRVARRKIRP